MRELRFIEREDQSLLVRDDSGARFRFQIDDDVIAEVRAIARRKRQGDTKVNPRLIQALLRAGKSHDEILEATDAEPSDIDRYAGPIVAEFAHILETARGVPVRIESALDDEGKTFGEVIDERLEQLGATDVVWKSWRDEDQGWMVNLSFSSHGVEHAAIWAFEHKKLILSPETTDAVNLSKQGEVGDRLIPTLRAVDDPERGNRFDSGAFEPLTDNRPPETDIKEPTPAIEGPTDHENTEYARRQEIEQRAIATESPRAQDLGETADLLDALRKRRGARAQSHEAMSAAERQSRANHPVSLPAAPTTLDERTAEQPSEDVTPDADHRPAKKGRAGIPSWDEILFGTRSEEDHE